VKPNNALHRTLPLRGSTLGPAALGAGERSRWAAEDETGRGVIRERLKDG
jgi:hypothetical protein